MVICLKRQRSRTEKNFISSEIDLQHLISDRIHFKTSFEDSYSCTCIQIRSNPIDSIQLTRPVNAFIHLFHKIKQKRIERCHEILKHSGSWSSNSFKKDTLSRCRHWNQWRVGLNISFISLR